MATSIKNKLLILPPIILGIIIIIFMISAKNPPEQRPLVEPAHKVRVIKAAAVPVVPRVLGYGTVAPQKIWNAIAEVSGRVLYVHPDFKQGAMLSAGTELVRISPMDYELAIAQIEANLRSAAAQLEELHVTGENTRASLNIEQRSLDIKEKELERKKKLLSKGTVAQSSVDAEQRNALLQSQQVQNLRNSLKLIPTQARVIEEQITVYEAQLADAELDLERTIVRLPFNARIAEANVEITQYAQVGQQIAIADGTKTSEVSAQIPTGLFNNVLTSEFDTGRIGNNPAALKEMFNKMGMTAEVRLRTGQDVIRWKGQVERISDTIDPQTRTVGVIVSVDDTYANAIPGERPPLVKGMYVEVELRTNPRAAMVVVPRSAVRNEHIFVVDEKSRLISRKVEVGLVQGNFIALKAGLSPGELLVVTDLAPALDGMLLDPVRDNKLESQLSEEASGVGSTR